jgi:hypothetical protein
LLKERSEPELVYLEAKWASLISYGLTGRLLADFLPVEQSVSKAVLSRQIDKVAERLESELREEPLDNMTNFPLPWDKQIASPAPLVVGLDGGYIHARKAKDKEKETTQIQIEVESQAQTSINEILSGDTSPQTILVDLADPNEQRKVSEQIPAQEIAKVIQKGDGEGGNWFEVIVGKSIGNATDEDCPPSKCFGFVNNYTTNSNSQRRVYETLKTQELQPNQQVIFMSDGGDTVRQVQLYLNAQSESILDWFHLVRQEAA